MDEEIAYAKVHRQGPQSVLAGCDRDLMGKRLENDGTTISIDPAFYGTDLITPDDLLAKSVGVASINLLGKAVVDLFMSNGFMDAESVILIDGIPHVQIYFF